MNGFFYLRLRGGGKGCESIHFWMERYFAFPPKDGPLLDFDFLSREDEITAFRSNSEAIRF